MEASAPIGLGGSSLIGIARLGAVELPVSEKVSL